MSGAGPERTPPSSKPEGELNVLRGRWTVAIGVAAWLAAVVTPALSFKITLALDSSLGRQIQAYLLIFAATMFLISWRFIKKLSLPVLGALAVASLILFVAYGLARESWTCAYYPKHYDSRFVMGTELLKPVHEFLANNQLADSGCETLMENWGGDAAKIWAWPGIVWRFLILFGLYTSAWLAMAILILGATQYSLRQRWRY